MKKRPICRVLLPGLALAVFSLIVSACSSSPPKPTVDYKADYNFMGVQKIAFYHKSGGVSGDNPMQLSDIQRDRIDTALNHALTNRGMQMVADPADADLLLSWHLVTANKTDVRTYETPAHGAMMGYGYNRYSMYHCWSCAPTRTEVSVRNYTQGTFIVDMIDPGLKKSVWRSQVQSRLKGQASENQDDYNNAAAALFASFPP